jgi:hypothetical protein
MKRLIQLKTTTPLLLTPLLLVCFACLPSTQAVTPAPDGGYPGYNTAEGLNALAPAIPGVWNTAIGGYALSSSAPGGIGNTAVGLNSLRHNSTGDFNSALGVNSLLFNSTGNQNVGIGYQALDLNTAGNCNTAVGFQTLFANKANSNVAVGYQALLSNTTGFFNVAVGYQALLSNSNGLGNNAFGIGALGSHTTGNDNTAIGGNALHFNIIGQSNTAVGDSALQNATTSGNTALGISAGINVNTANNVICIGSPGLDVSNSCFIGRIRGVTTVNANAIPVLIDSAGQLGTASSSRRYKKEIKPMDSASESILALKPVTFHYKSDGTGTPQFGLIAEEVAEVNPDLVVREKGEIYTVRYDAVNAMLLNEFLKEHRKVEEQNRKIQEQEATITQLKKEMGSVVASLKEQAAQIQKVSDRLEATSPVPKVVVNNP